MDSAQEKRIRRYLLGRLTEQEKAEFETSFVADDSAFEELLIVEEDLRDAFACGELSASDSAAFENNLLCTPKQLQRQRFAVALQNCQAQTTIENPSQMRESFWITLLRVLQARPIFVTAFSTVLVAAIVAGVWSLRHGTAPLINAPHATASQSTRDAAPEQQATNIITLELRGDMVRSGGQEMPFLLVPPGAKQVRLEAPVEGNYPRYEAILQTVAGATLATYSNLQPQTTPAGKKIDVVIPSSLLPPEDYILMVRISVKGSHETVGEYSFRIKN